MTNPEKHEPDIAAATSGVDAAGHRWTREGDGWKYYGITPTADVIANYGPIRWYDANDKYLGTSLGGDSR